ncbi:thiolase family protein [Paraburkholderia caribensis]|uniref:thiolase family protein n=1 Tax=Paraburkholderia TaxID=1822464 RepID=UPI001CB61809|nr:thiolase family protein [Paraburkholderia caribensis]BEU25688.1 thiolase family protein [Paraburkholderia sp. 22B1P]CAG9249422.1 3-ketoacyl-CoA thiolase [Paraburkholderia caribensis]
MTDVVVAGFARSPFHFARKGGLIDIRPDDLAAQVVSALLKRTGCSPELIEDLVVGCAHPEAEQGYNVARIIGFLAGFGDTIPGMTVNRFCGSSMSAVHYAAGQIALGMGDAFICGGVESMTRVPLGGANKSPNPVLVRDYPAAYIPMGITAENVARQFDVSRADQEALAVVSHEKAAAAREAGRLADEIVPIDTPQGIVKEDGCIRPGTSRDGLASLKPAFIEDGSVTAGTSSPLTDGASAVLLCSLEFARRHGLNPLARIRSAAVASCDPSLMGIGPIPATRKALARSGISVEDLDVVEINEAFASQAIACARDLGLDPTRTNIDGGALAIGHPLGATGARLVGKAASLLTRTGGQFALATQCIGGGQGIATILEAI